MREVLVSTVIGNISAGLDGAMRMHQHSSAFGTYPGGVAVRQAPSLGPCEAIGACSSPCSYAPSSSLRGIEG
jgi:hypothetical protein